MMGFFVIIATKRKSRRDPSAAAAYYTYDGEAGKPSNKQLIFSNITIILLASTFGAIHCLAWYFAFPTPEVRMLWRVCSVFLAAAPIVIGLLYFLFLVGWCGPAIFEAPVVVGYLIQFFMPFAWISYAAAHLSLIVIAFYRLWHVPPTAHQAIEWVDLFIHF
jgi:hypothetical protein